MATGHAQPHQATSSGTEAAKVTLAFVAVVLAMLPAVLDQTILATALPTIASDLGHLTDVSWIVTAYVVAAAATMPVWGKLGDRHGRKLLLKASLAIFLAASALCGIAQDMTVLVASRTLQGAAAGGLMTLAMASVGDLVSPRERGRYQGYITATFAAATVVGPLIGGLLVEQASWRWVFYVNIPLGLLAFFGLSRRLPAPPSEQPRRAFDAAGAGLLAGATTALMVALIWGGTRYAWGSATILTLIGTAAALAGALALRERRAEDPIVPLGLLRTPVVAIASAGMFMATASLFAVTVFVPLFLQATTGASATQAGLLLIPMMLGLTASTNFAGRSIERTGRYKRFPVAGLTLMAGSLALLAALAGDPSRLRTGIAIAVFGLGFGMVSQVLIVAVQNSVDRRELGIAMATANFFRGLGGAVGAAVLGAVFAARVGALGAGAGPSALGTSARAEVIDAVQSVFIVAAPIAALGLLVVLGLREVPLRGRGERAAAGAERTAPVAVRAKADGGAMPKQSVPAPAAR
jgi:EmrB/QacA subfamily drug resistance transporter